MGLAASIRHNPLPKFGHYPWWRAQPRRRSHFSLTDRAHPNIVSGCKFPPSNSATSPYLLPRFCQVSPDATDGSPVLTGRTDLYVDQRVRKIFLKSRGGFYWNYVRYGDKESSDHEIFSLAGNKWGNGAQVLGCLLCCERVVRVITSRYEEKRGFWNRFMLNAAQSSVKVI